MVSLLRKFPARQTAGVRDREAEEGRGRERETPAEFRQEAVGKIVDRRSIEIKAASCNNSLICDQLIQSRGGKRYQSRVNSQSAAWIKLHSISPRHTTHPHTPARGAGRARPGPAERRGAAADPPPGTATPGGAAGAGRGGGLMFEANIFGRRFLKERRTGGAGPGVSGGWRGTLTIYWLSLRRQGVFSVLSLSPLCFRCRKQTVITKWVGSRLRKTCII